MLFATFLLTAESWKLLFYKYIRIGLVQYVAVICIICLHYRASLIVGA